MKPKPANQARRPSAGDRLPVVADRPSATSGPVIEVEVNGARVQICDHLDLCGAATIKISDNGSGEIAFGAMEARREIVFGRASIDFTWIGFDEGDEVSGEGSAAC